MFSDVTKNQAKKRKNKRTYIRASALGIIVW